jgi:hypothetical protein
LPARKNKNYLQNHSGSIITAFYRSLMMYFLTSLFAAGGVASKEIENMEANKKKS